MQCREMQPLQMNSDLGSEIVIKDEYPEIKVEQQESDITETYEFSNQMQTEYSNHANMEINEENPTTVKVMKYQVSHHCNDRNIR